MAHIEIERKYVIELPDIRAMRALSDYNESEILQIYIDSPPSVTHRIRSRRQCGEVVYTETKKIRIDKMSAVEDEREIGAAEFSRLAATIKKGTVPINKVRHTFSYGGQLFEIDVYPQWKKTCIMETELKARDASVDFPPFIRIVSEVTGDKAYSNASMSASFPSEISLASEEREI